MTEEKPLPPAPKKLTAEQRSKVIEWIKNHAKKGCPVCGHATWQLGNDLVEIKQHYGAPVLGGYGVYPLVMFTCENCAHVFFFQAKRIGALEQRQPESKKDGD
jgi:hypothetical protein